MMTTKTIHRRRSVPLALGVALASGLLLAACSSPAPEPTLYLLRGDPQEGEGPTGGALRVGLGRVMVAPYLASNPGIVVETAPGIVRPGRHHQWAEPLDQAMRWYLRMEIGRALGHEVGGGLVDVATWDYTVDVYVARLHGTMQGEAVLESGYVIRSSRDLRVVREYRFARSKSLADEGYDALVEAERQLLTELSGAIAASIDELARARPAEPVPAAEPEQSQPPGS